MKKLKQINNMLNKAFNEKSKWFNITFRSRLVISTLFISAKIKEKKE